MRRRARHHSKNTDRNLGRPEHGRPYELTISGGGNGSPSLEAEARLQFNYATGQACSRPAKVWIRDNRAGVEEPYRREIQLVEGVKEVGSDLERGPFAKAPDLSEPRLFYQAQVDVVILRPTEGIAADAGRAGRRYVKELRAAAGKIAALPDECLVGGIVERPAEVSRWPDRTKRLAARLPQVHKNLGGVRKPGMVGPNAVDPPSTQKSTHPTGAASSQWELPHS